MPSKATDLVLTTLQLRSPSRGTTLQPRERSLPTLPPECRLDDLASNERCRRSNLEQNPPSNGVLADPQDGDAHCLTFARYSELRVLVLQFVHLLSQLVQLCHPIWTV